MSVVRFSEGSSDVYVYYSFDQMIECCSCWLEKNRGVWRCTTEDEMISHLQKHEHAGHLVPPWAYVRLSAENEATENER